MQVLVIPVTTFQQNCTLVWCESSRHAVVIDPGGDLERITAAIEQEGVELTQILLTHGHIDHAGAAADLAEALEVPIVGPQREDQFWIDQLPEQSQLFQFPQARPFTPQHWLEEGDHIRFGEVVLEVLHCPGHTPGHVVFFHRESETAFVGDLLFKGSIGRTDFPRSDHQALLNSIRNKLWPLGDEVLFIPGHGASSTFAAERRDNPFVADDLL